jgi:hypothetical protein
MCVLVNVYLSVCLSAVLCESMQQWVWKNIRHARIPHSRWRSVHTQYLLYKTGTKCHRNCAFLNLSHHGVYRITDAKMRRPFDVVTSSKWGVLSGCCVRVPRACSNVHTQHTQRTHTVVTKYPVHTLMWRTIYNDQLITFSTASPFYGRLAGDRPTTSVTVWVPLLSVISDKQKIIISTVIVKILWYPFRDGYCLVIFLNKIWGNILHHLSSTLCCCIREEFLSVDKLKGMWQNGNPYRGDFD